MDDALELAQYQMITWHHGRKMVRMRNGERSVIFLKFDFRRAIGFYILQVVCSSLELQTKDPEDYAKFNNHQEGPL